MFGFHLCALEWRQHRDKVVRALDEIVARVDRSALSRDAASAAWLEREAASDIACAFSLDAVVSDACARGADRRRSPR